MTRSKWKGPYTEPSLSAKIQTQNPNTYHKLKIWSRKSVILPQLVGYKIEIYNGMKYVPCLIKEEMIGHKFGEFVFTRKRCIHKKKTTKVGKKK